MAKDQAPKDVMDGVLPKVEGGDVATVAPQRSWKRGNRAPGTFESLFEYEGARVYLNGLGKDEWKEFEDQEKQLFQQQQDFEDEVKARVQQEQEKIASRAASNVALSPEQIEAERKADAETAEQWNERKEKLENAQLEALTSLVERTVVAWTGAPTPFTSGAVRELPIEIITEWAGIIVDKSRLSAKEGDFLAK